MYSCRVNRIFAKFVAKPPRGFGQFDAQLYVLGNKKVTIKLKFNTGIQGSFNFDPMN